MDGNLLYSRLGLGIACLISHKPLAQENRLCRSQSQRDEKPRVHQRPPYRAYGMRYNGKKENDHADGYCPVASCDVQGQSL